MRCSIVLLAAAIVQGGVCIAQSRNDTQEPLQQARAERTEPLKPISTPSPDYPGGAIKKGIEGKVTLRIVVDVKGHVTQATPVSGPPELIAAAVAAVHTWQFESSLFAPRAATVEVSFGLPKQCPGPVSDFGEVETNGRLADEHGKVVATYDDDFKNDLPVYCEKDRKAGVSGELVLLITLSATAQLQKVQVFKSLSPTLDQATLDAVRSWKFKRFDPNSSAPLENLRLFFRFGTVCWPRF